MNREFKLRSFAVKVVVVITISLLIPALSLGADRMVVENDTGTTTLKIQDSGTLGTLGNLSVGTMDSPTTFTVVKGGATEATSFTNYSATFFNTGSAYFGFRNSTDDAEGLFGVGGGAGARFGFGSVTNHPIEFFVNYTVTMLLDNDGSLDMMLSGAKCTAGGVWTNASSREYKENIKSLSSSKAMDALEQLNPVEFNYKVDPEEKHLGFIAEDVPDLVASRDRKGMSPMDVVAVLTKALQEQHKMVQEQQKMLQDQKKTITELSKEMAELKKELRPKGTPTLAKLRLND